MRGCSVESEKMSGWCDSENIRFHLRTSETAWSQARLKLSVYSAVIPFLELITGSIEEPSLLEVYMSARVNSSIILISYYDVITGAFHLLLLPTTAYRASAGQLFLNVHDSSKNNKKNMEFESTTASPSLLLSTLESYLRKTSFRSS